MTDEEQRILKRIRNMLEEILEPAKVNRSQVNGLALRLLAMRLEEIKLPENVGSWADLDGAAGGRGGEGIRVIKYYSKADRGAWTQATRQENTTHKVFTIFEAWEEGYRGRGPVAARPTRGDAWSGLLPTGRHGIGVRRS